VRLRTNKTRGCVSRQTILSLVFQLGQSASKRWRRLRGFKHLADVIRGVKFENGVRVDTEDSRAAPDSVTAHTPDLTIALIGILIN
jgi:putative transposase